MYKNIKRGGAHFYWLDLVRFLAAFLVLACHFRGAFFVDYSSLSPEQQNPVMFLFFSITRLGNESVMIFFVLSGFLVGGKSIERVQNGTFRLSDFTIDRTVRIMLPLISCLLLYIPTAIVCGITIDWVDWVGCLFSLQWIWTGAVIPQLWSLNYEVWFYVLCGALCMILPCRRYDRRIGLCLVALFVTILMFTHLSTHYLFIWFMGAVAYVCRPKKFNRWIFAFSFIGIIMMVIIMMVAHEGIFETGIAKYINAVTDNKKAIELWFALPVCIFLQQLILCRPKQRLSVMVEHVGSKLASFSYTLYLTHGLVLLLLVHFGAPKSESVNIQSLMLYFAWLCVAMLFAWIVYFFFEKRTASCKKFIKRKLKFI